MRPAFGQVADVTDMVSRSIFIYVLENLLVPTYGFCHFECFKDRAAVTSPSTQVVDFAASWGDPELFDETGYIVGMNVISDLFPLVAKDPIWSTFNVTEHQVAEETVELYAAVIWSS
jgi:hypothetical protein